MTVETNWHTSKNEEIRYRYAWIDNTPIFEFHLTNRDGQRVDNDPPHFAAWADRSPASRWVLQVYEDYYTPTSVIVESNISARDCWRKAAAALTPIPEGLF